MSKYNQDNKNIRVISKRSIKHSRLIKYGFYNIDSEIITISYNSKINSEIKFTADKNKWQTITRLLLNELEQYEIDDSETRLLSKKFLNDNKDKILADYSNTRK